MKWTLVMFTFSSFLHFLHFSTAKIPLLVV